MPQHKNLATYLSSPFPPLLLPLHWLGVPGDSLAFGGFWNSASDLSQDHHHPVYFLSLSEEKKQRERAWVWKPGNNMD